MSKPAYHPDRGELNEMNFQPAAAYNRKAGICLAVPTSTNLTPGPLWISMPAGFVPRPSLILCEYLKNFDYRERSAAFVAKLPPDLLDQIVANLLDLLDPMR